MNTQNPAAGQAAGAITEAGQGGLAPDVAVDARQQLIAVGGEVGKAVVGQDQVISGLVIALLCQGHVLLEGVPGVAKTLLVRALAAALSLDFKRVQFTPDLMPGDVTGSLIYDARTAQFEFRAGPVFTNLLLADEINRTPPKTQAALLEAMEERQVVGGGQPRALPVPFIVAATQNPVEYEGTYPLPEAQLDRFLLKLAVPLPERDAEIGILARHAPASIRATLARPGSGRCAARRAWRPPARRCATCRCPPRCPATSSTSAARPGSRRRCSLACRRAARPRCWPRAGRGPGCPAATTSPPMTSRRWPGRRSGTGSSCGPRPSLRVRPPTACSTACWPPSRYPGEGRLMALTGTGRARCALIGALVAVAFRGTGPVLAVDLLILLAIVADVVLAASVRQLTVTRSATSGYCSASLARCWSP